MTSMINNYFKSKVQVFGGLGGIYLKFYSISICLDQECGRWGANTDLLVNFLFKSMILSSTHISRRFAPRKIIGVRV